jgi:hypothetical protein
LGANSFVAIFRFGRRLPPEAWKMAAFPAGKAPYHASYFNVFQSVDGDALSRLRTTRCAFLKGIR